jgi:hypothetical protein
VTHSDRDARVALTRSSIDAASYCPLGLQAVDKPPTTPDDRWPPPQADIDLLSLFALSQSGEEMKCVLKKPLSSNGAC